MAKIKLHEFYIFPIEQGGFCRVYCPISNSYFDVKQQPDKCPQCSEDLTKMRPPRYDDVYSDGVEQLNKMQH